MNPELEELSRSLQADPRNSRLLRKMGRYLLQNGFYKQARDEYHLSRLFDPHIAPEIMLDHERVLGKNKMDVQARLSLVDLCLKNMELDPAMLEIEELLDIDPMNIQAYNLLGRLYIKLDKVDEAMSLLEHALRIGIKDVSISEMLASVYLEKGRFKEAISFYEELPQDKKVLRTLGELCQRTGDLDKSAEKYFLMYKADPEVASEVQHKLEELLLKNIGSITIREHLAELYMKGMKPDLAVKKFSEILKIVPERSEEISHKLKELLKNYPLNPDATLALAENLADRGCYSEAIEEYYKLIRNKPDLSERAVNGCRAIIEKYPNQFLARQFLIETFIGEERFAEAAGDIKTLLKMYPDSADWVIGKCRDLVKKSIEIRECIGYAHLMKNDFQKANIEAENLLMIDRQSIPALILLGEIFLRQKLCRKARETLSRALEKRPYEPLIHEKYREARLKELELEAEQIKKRIAEDEWKMSLHLDLGKNLLERGEKDEAIREFQISLKDSQRAPFIYLMLGDLYRNEGMYDQSLDAFKKGLQFMSAENIDNQKKIKFGMALTAEAQGQARTAIKLLEEIEQEDIDFPGLKEKIKQLKSTSLSSLQNKCLAVILKDPEKKKTLGFWGRELKKPGPKQALSVSFGQNYNNSGIEFFLKGMHSAAEEEFGLSVQLDPHYLAGLNNLAVAKLMNGKYPEALHRLRDAFNLDPGSAIVLNNLGTALFLNGLNAEAVLTLNRAIALDPELSSAKINLADVMYASGKVKEALELYRQIRPSDLVHDIAQKRLLYKVP